METTQGRKAIIEVANHRLLLAHFWVSGSSLVRCIATWQQNSDGRWQAECQHAVYVVKEP